MAADVEDLQEHLMVSLLPFQVICGPLNYLDGHE